MTIRQATREDLSAMQRLFVETIQSSCQEDYTPAQIAVWTSGAENQPRWLNLLREQYCVVAEVNQIIVGFGSLDKGSYLDFLYVHKDYQRKGVATHIYVALKNESESQGCNAMTADVSKTALPFFEAKGFMMIKENRKEISGVEIVNYHMRQ